MSVPSKREATRLVLTQQSAPAFTNAQHAAAVVIQSRVRQYLAAQAVSLMKERKQWNLAHGAAVLFQKVYRGYCKRAQVLRFKARLRTVAACMIQRRYRVRLAWKQVTLLREVAVGRKRRLAAAMLQRWLKGCVVRNDARLKQLVREAGVVAIQRIYRGHRARSSVGKK